jgi:hypothetical protein
MFLTYEPDGTWYVVSKTYHEDGTVSITRNGAEPWAWGTYSLDGSTLTYSTDPEAGDCPDTRGSYDLAFIDADTVKYEVIEDDCSGRKREFVREPHERADVAAIEGSDSAAPQSPATAGAGPTTEDAERLVDTWKVGTGGYLTWEPDGTWYVDETPQGRVDPWAWGTYTFDGSTVTMDESPDATECPNSQGTYTVAWIDADTLRMELIDEDCDTRRYGQHAAMKHVRVTEQSSEG